MSGSDSVTFSRDNDKDDDEESISDDQSVISALEYWYDY